MSDVLLDRFLDRLHELGALSVPPSDLRPAVHDAVDGRVIVAFANVDVAREVVLSAEFGMTHVYVAPERVRSGLKAIRRAIAEMDDA